MDLPNILTEQRVEEAGELVRRYYLVPEKKTGLLSSGSQFDSWAAGDAAAHPNEISDSDLVAVSLLTVSVPGKAAMGLRAAKETVDKLLAQIPTDLDLHDVPADKVLTIIGKNSPASALWYVLVGDAGAKWGIGSTVASKIMARKRPRLIPVWDTVIGHVIGKRGPRDQWTNWHALLTNETGLPDRLERIHKLSTVEEPLSHLRIMDVVLWMYGKDQGYVGGRSRRMP